MLWFLWVAGTDYGDCDIENLADMEDATLQKEPDNEYHNDEESVAIKVIVGGKRLGYVPERYCRYMCCIIDEGMIDDIRVVKAVSGGMKLAFRSSVCPVVNTLYRRVEDDTDA